MSAYAQKAQQVLAALADGATVGVSKPTSNLFRDRAVPTPRVSLARFNEVIEVDPVGRTVEAEGLITYQALADACLAQGLMPGVVPQLKSITLGGAVAGVGIESTSFREGLVHHGLVSMDVLTGDHRLLHCTADNAYADLFHGLPNSYGTLGYALKVRVRAPPVKPYVQLQHVRYRNAEHCFADLVRHIEGGDLDFLDGVVFARDDIYLTQGRFVEAAPFTSDYTYRHIFYRSIRERSIDYLTVRDYLWRWDTDWFWCSKNVGAQHPLLRRLYGPRRLNSITYQRIMRWNTRWGLTAALNRLRGIHTESVIQDVDVPVAQAPRFLDFLLREVGVLPIWICPIAVPRGGAAFALYPMKEGALYVNFGFWDVVSSVEPREPGQVNRRIEQEVETLGGIKSLYSDAYYDEATFARLYNGEAYRALKAKYDPQGRRGDLYRKCVRQPGS